MKNPRRKNKNSSVALDVVACALSAVSVGLSVAAFVISLAKKKNAEKWKKLLTGGESLWYSIKAVAERRGGRTEKIWKEWKKFLTNGFEFDILNKLFRKRQRSEKFEFWGNCFKNFEKSFEKVLDKRNFIWYNKQAANERLGTSKSSEKSCFQQIVPCKLNNDVLKTLFKLNEVVVRTWNFESFLLLVNRWKSQLQLK